MTTTLIPQPPLAVTGEDCGYIAITAAEGGIGYWSVIDKYAPSRWCDDAENGCDEVDDDFVFYTLRPDNDDEGWVVRVTPRLIKDGIASFLDQPWRKNTFDDMTDLAAMDSVEADTVIQLGAFGELVYS